MTTICFAGLGNMGAPMARNLVGAGYELKGFDVGLSKLDGVPTASSLKEAALNADLAITMLPDGAVVLKVIEELLEYLHPGSLIIDCSTIDVSSARKAASLALEKGIETLDAPVSGGIGGAQGATLTFMVGGSDEAFTRAFSLFDVMGSKAVHCGPSGSGQAAKICNNMLLGISMIGACEAFALAQELDLDQRKLFDVISTSSGSCWSVNTYCPVPGIGPVTPADHDYKPGFAASLMLKDLKLAQQAAKETGAMTPLGEAAASLYEEFAGQDTKGQDFSAILPFLKKQSQKEQ